MKAENQKLTLDLGNGMKMELILIPRGKFLMGSPDMEKGRSSIEGPQHEVTIAKPFYMGVNLVTQEQWQAVMGSNPSQPKGKGNQPVCCTNFYDCQAFCEILSAKTGQTVRLPSEAEREYAGRAGTTTRFSYGDDPDYSQLREYAWVGSNSDGDSYPVGQKKPNPWGLYDMYGNIWEWCQDWFHDSYTGAPSNGSAWATLTGHRVLRGACFYSVGKECRSASRDWADPGNRCGDVGVRVVVSVTP